MILLDTDVMIDFLRQHPPAAAWLDSLGEEEIVLPGFVVMELLQGCRDKVEQEKVERELGAYGVAWPSLETCDEAQGSLALASGCSRLHRWSYRGKVIISLCLASFRSKGAKHYGMQIRCAEM